MPWTVIERNVLRKHCKCLKGENLLLIPSNSTMGTRNLITALLRSKKDFEQKTHNAVLFFVGHDKRDEGSPFSTSFAYPLDVLME